MVIAAPDKSLKIIGRTTPDDRQYRDMVVLLYSFNSIFYFHACAGVIVKPRAVLTAAHCPIGDAVNQWRMRAGSKAAHSGGVVHTFSSYIIHPSFNEASFMDCDLAIMRTNNPIMYTVHVQPAHLAGGNYVLQDNEMVWATGWGATSLSGPRSELLQHVQIWTINHAICNSRYETLSQIVTDNMICSGWLDVGLRDQCHGDSGGPLYHNGVVVGICSWGEECAHPEYPGINVDLRKFRSWMDSNI
ncbi:hypothetical protein K1T71_008556 [Dendrolimus kikuchii]|uniref:Uncharacterized protein n=1 Tax=Dendrolimus kikuchii TaxID=765133 RepID=A0ACC1CUZ3_9NEOP|nr:hypothetical protein K1T71_008556 [Dendrolimus kikuchii]